MIVKFKIAPPRHDWSAPDVAMSDVPRVEDHVTVGGRDYRVKRVRWVPYGAAAEGGEYTPPHVVVTLTP